MFGFVWPSRPSSNLQYIKKGANNPYHNLCKQKYSDIFCMGEYSNEITIEQNSFYFIWFFKKGKML